MRVLFFIIAFISTNLLAQTSYSFKISDIKVSSSNIMNSNSSKIKLTLPNNKVFTGYVNDKTAKEYGFKNRARMLDHIETEYNQRLSLFPNATIQFKLDENGLVILNDKTIRLLNTGESNDSQLQTLKIQNDILEAQIKELKENRVAKETFNYVEEKLSICQSDVSLLKVSLASYQTNTDNSEMDKMLLDWLQNNDSETQSVVNN